MFPKEEASVIYGGKVVVDTLECLAGLFLISRGDEKCIFTLQVGDRFEYLKPQTSMPGFWELVKI